MATRQLVDGARLAAIRREQRLTRRAVALAAGTTPGYLYRLESGRQINPTILVIANLADALQVEAREIVPGLCKHHSEAV
jgi:transcriptional regulator with XRE-family HTH domain